MTSNPDFRPIPYEEVMVGGTKHRRDAMGSLIPEGAIKPQDLLMDEVVRKVAGYGLDLSDRITRFAAHAAADVEGLLEVLAQEYDAPRGGRKGNVTLTSLDGLLKVQVQVADLIEFGPELQTAKELFDQCVNDWAEGARDELRAVVTRAFNTDKAGQINRAEIYSLLRLEIADARWQQATRAIRDAMRVIGTKRYMRMYRRDAPDGLWQPISIDLSKT